MSGIFAGYFCGNRQIPGKIGRQARNALDFYAFGWYTLNITVSGLIFMKKVIPIVIMSALLFVVCPICEASIMSRLCSSFANVLDNEETKTAAAVKNCKKNCALIQKKHDLIKTAQKKVDDSCAKNIAPDITKVSAGLDKNVQAKLRKQYNQHSKLYDGTADLDKDFGLTTKSNQSPVLGKGGQVTDLKGSAPDLNKLSPVTEFSLSGKKLSGETPGQTTTKQSPILLASAASAKSPADTAAAAKTNLSPQKAQAAGSATPRCPDPKTATICPAGPCQADKSCILYSDPDLDIGVPGFCTSFAYCQGHPSRWKRFKDWLYGLFGREPCGGSYYKIKTQCCVNEMIFKKCGGKCYDPITEYCENENICDEACSAGVISATPAPINGEVILAVGETAALSVSGEKGDQLQWSKTSGTLTPSSDNKRATITSANPGKITVTFGSKTCSKCRTSITVAFVNVTRIDATPTWIKKGETIKFIVETNPPGVPYIELVKLTRAKSGITDIPPPAGSVREIRIYLEGNKKIWVYQFNEPAGFVVRATAGGSDEGQITELIQVDDWGPPF